MSRNWLIALVVAFVLGFGLKSYLQQAEQPSPESSSKATLFGKDNQALQLFDSQDQRVRVAYFGFTRCPDVCPTSLAMLAGALNQVDDETKSHFRPVFISLDPERDAATDAHRYAQYFHPMIEGLSAPLETTKPLADKYGVIFRKTELEMDKVQLSAAVENIPSRSVAERAGMTLEGVITNQEKVGDRILDHAIYGIHKNR